MKIQKKKIFYCNQCKKISHEIDEVIFIEQGHFRSFCSEKCIVEFFGPLMGHLEKEEKKLRKELGIQTDIKLENEELDKLIESTLRRPQEIWLDFEGPTEEIYYFINFISSGERPHYVIMAVLVFEGGPSFVLWHTLTCHEKMVQVYRSGQNLQERGQQGEAMAFEGLGHGTPGTGDLPAGSAGEGPRDHGFPSSVGTGGEKHPHPSRGTEGHSAPHQGREVSGTEEIVMDPKDIEAIEGRRSALFSKLLSERSAHDIPVESFAQYEGLAQSTLELPDEIYRSIEETGEIFFTYIKSFQLQKSSFFYIVICLHYSTDVESGEDTLIPMISFPSCDGELYNKYKRGEKISGNLKS